MYFIFIQIILEEIRYGRRRFDKACSNYLVKPYEKRINSLASYKTNKQTRRVQIYNTIIILYRERGKGVAYLISPDTNGLQDIVDNNAQLFKLLDISPSDQTLFENGLEKFAEWNFDSITFHHMLGEQGFILISIKVMCANVSLKMLGIPIQELIGFLKEVQTIFYIN